MKNIVMINRRHLQVAINKVNKERKDEEDFSPLSYDVLIAFITDNWTAPDDEEQPVVMHPLVYEGIFFYPIITQEGVYANILTRVEYGEEQKDDFEMYSLPKESEMKAAQSEEGSKDE